MSSSIKSSRSFVIRAKRKKKSIDAPKIYKHMRNSKEMPKFIALFYREMRIQEN